MFVPSGVSMADATIVRNMHVAHLEPGPLAVQSARPSAESRRSCVSIDSGLVWSTTCESSPRRRILDRRRNALRIDQAPRRHVFDVFQTHPLLDVRRSFKKPLRISSQAVRRSSADAGCPVVDVVDVGLRVAATRRKRYLTRKLGLPGAAPSRLPARPGRACVDAERPTRPAGSGWCHRTSRGTATWPSPTAVGCRAAAAGRSSVGFLVAGGAVVANAFKSIAASARP